MSLNGIRDAIKTALATVTSLKETYDNAPESIGALPAAYVVPKSGSYHDTFDGQIHHLFEVVLLVSQAPGLASAQDTLDGYLAESGTNSLLVAIEAATLSTHGDAIIVKGYRDYGGITYNGINYVGVKLDVEVHT